MDINKNASSTSIHRSRRKIKKQKPNDSFVSDINELPEQQKQKQSTTLDNHPNSTSNRIIITSNSFVDEDQPWEEEPEEISNDIKMEGNWIYRYSLDQIELDGNWSISSSSQTKEHFSYLLNSKLPFLQFPISKHEINFSHYDPSLNASKYMSHDNESFILTLCAANLFEAWLIPNTEIFIKILEFLTGEYHGFFVYYSKTIEDRFNLNFTFDSLVKINGAGTNSWGDFSILGYVNFYTMKDQMIGNNKLESDVINLGEIHLTRLYNKFDINENTRVIKSYQYSRKRNADGENDEDDDDDDYDGGDNNHTAINNNNNNNNNNDDDDECSKYENRYDK